MLHYTSNSGVIFVDLILFIYYLEYAFFLDCNTFIKYMITSIGSQLLARLKYINYEDLNNKLMHSKLIKQKKMNNA